MVMGSGAHCYLGQRVLVGYYFQSLWVHLSSSKSISLGFNVKPQAGSDRYDIPPLSIKVRPILKRRYTEYHCTKYFDIMS